MARAESEPKSGRRLTSMGIIRMALALVATVTVLLGFVPVPAVYAQVGVDGVIGPEWTGVTPTNVPYSGPAGSCAGGPPPDAHLVGYDVYVRCDANYLYIGLRALPATNPQGWACVSALSLCTCTNIYLDTDPCTSPGADIVFEPCFTDMGFQGSYGPADGSANYDIAAQPGIVTMGNMGPMDAACPASAGDGSDPNTMTGGVREWAISWNLLETDPDNVGFPKLTPGNPIVNVRTIQAFGYNFSGSQFPNRFGGCSDPNFGTPSLTINDVTKAEGNSGKSAFDFTVTLSPASSSTVTVDFATADGAPLDGATLANNDYQWSSGTLTFAPCETSKTVSISVNGDIIKEGNESFFVNLTNPTGGALLGTMSSGKGTITNDDAAPTLSINSVAQNEGNSGKTLYTFTVTESGSTSQTVTVDFATADGTARLANNDYQATSGTLTFPAKTVSGTATITVSVNGDNIEEGNESFFVKLSNPTGGATIATSTGTGTITNDDGPPILVINNVTQNEGNSGKTPYVFTVSLSKLSGFPVTVNFATADGSATVANNDYQPTSGTLTIPPKTASGTVTVSVNGDGTQEGTETFLVQLSSPVNATLGGSSVGTGTILNEDAPPSITIDDVKVTEGNSGKTLAVLTLHLSNGSASPLTTTVDYFTSDGSATLANNDYQAASGTVTFPDKTTSATLTVSVNGDITNEPDETFFVNLVNATNGTIADNRATVTINNDDDTTPPVVQVKIPNGGENFFVGSPAKISWNNTDTNRCTADILLARDGVNYNEVIVLGTPDDGSFVWNVNGPGTNTSATPVFIAKIKVVAHDCAGNTGEDTSDNGFSIFDIATSALLSVFEAQAFDEGGVELRWQLAVEAQVADLGLERGDKANGPWAALAVESRVEDGVTVAVDRSAESGKSYFYRLSGTLRSGEKVVLGTLSSKAGERITEFALKRVFPNPTRGMLRIEYAVPLESKVALRVVDVAGRVVANLADGVVRPGRYQAVWNGRGADGSKVGAGMYFVQFKAPGKNLVQRVVMAQ